MCLQAEAPQEDHGFVEERRLRLWSAQTRYQDLVYSAYLRVDHMEGTDPGSWVYEWSLIGDYFAEKGKKLAAKDDGDAEVGAGIGPRGIRWVAARDNHCIAIDIAGFVRKNGAER